MEVWGGSTEVGMARDGNLTKYKLIELGDIGEIANYQPLDNHNGFL